MENTKLQLSDLKVSNLPELQGWKEKQEKLVAENPYVEITDNKTYEVACKRRTNFVKGRTELEKQDKFIASQVASFRKDVKTETENLIAITLPSEEKQQAEVKRYEGIKEAEKAEKERIEQERVDGIKFRIESFETDSYKIIQETNIGNIALQKSMLDAMVNTEFDFEEYDILFEQVRSRVQALWDAKCSDIDEKEKQRIANEELEEENRKIKAQQELQATRLNEIMPYVAFGEAVDLTKLFEFESESWKSILNAKKSLFEVDALQKKELQEQHDAREKEEKVKIFDIRKSRLAEIGFDVETERSGFFLHPDLFDGVDIDALFNLDTIWFETKISEAKSGIKKAKDKAEKEKKDAEEAELQKAKDLELSIADAKKLKAENKARIAKYAKDKETLTSFIGSLDFAHAVPELDNEHSFETLGKLISDFNEFKEGWLNNIKAI